MDYQLRVVLESGVLPFSIGGWRGFTERFRLDELEGGPTLRYCRRDPSSTAFACQRLVLDQIG